ncbi:TonB-dependent hemoglobin/transferrin/lactoferrin family receptor [Aquabacter cavernae]|uniref:TonB-dependent hemoglobin/transferrin/lactoferrin family receptor n=1 Tax=Aquabacter cavernae TaxID=2496029 RepID=UPI000F8CF99E|nr:TonB-dependent hemoglobin/transferrin/lactoferrin family receptor [Aquabacter cavernae]
MIRVLAKGGVCPSFRCFWLSSAAGAALLTGLATSAYAQTAPTAPGQPVAANDSIALDSITVVSTLTGIQTVDALGPVSVLRADQFEQLMANQTSDLFLGMPGVTAIQNGNSQQTSINIRGMQDFGRVAVFVDGARQNFTQLGHANAAGSFFLEPALLSSVDVFRGPASNIYGSGAIGGVVTFRTKDADDILKPGQTWGVESTGEFGSNGPMGFGSMFGAARVGQNVDLFVGGTYRKATDYQDGNGDDVPGTAFDTWTGIAKATFRPADFHEVKVSALNYNSTYTTSNDVPTPGLSQYGTQVINQTLTASYNYANPDDNLFDWNSTVYWNRVEQNQVKVAGTPSAITGAIGNPRSFTIDTTGFDANNTSRFDFYSVRNAVTIGGEYFNDNVSNIDNYGFGDGYNPSGERDVGGAFVQWQGNYSSWLEAIAAVRYDSYSLNGGNTSNSDSRFSPKFTLGVTPLPWFTVYGTYAEAFRAPTVTETLVSGAHPPAIPIVTCPDGSYGTFCFMPNPNLQAEVGKNKEIGVNIKYDDLFVKGDKIRLKANAYQNDVSDYIELVQYGRSRYGTTAYAQYQNIASAKITGYELESMYDTGIWFLGVNGTITRGENTEDGQPLSTIMPDNIATTIGVRMMDGKLTMSARWVAVAAVTAADLPVGSVYDPTSSFNLVNFYVGYRPSENVLAAASVENVLNEQYTQYQQFLPSAGITFKGSLTIKFGDGYLASLSPSGFTR